MRNEYFFFYGLLGVVRYTSANKQLDIFFILGLFSDKELSNQFSRL